MKYSFISVVGWGNGLAYKHGENTLENLYSFDPYIWAKMRKMSYFDPYFLAKFGKMYSFTPLFNWPCSISSQLVVLSIPIRTLPGHTRHHQAITSTDDDLLIYQLDNSQEKFSVQVEWNMMCVYTYMCVCVFNEMHLIMLSVKFQKFCSCFDELNGNAIQSISHWLDAIHKRANRTWQKNVMMTSWYGNAFRITDYARGESIGYRWITITKGQPFVHSLLSLLLAYTTC